MAENLVYRGHPLRRVDNLVYYGSMADKYIITMQVLDTEDVKDLKLAKRVSIQPPLARPRGPLHGEGQHGRGHGVCHHLARARPERQDVSLF